VRAQITVPVRRLLDVLSGAGARVADPVRAAVDATAAGCARAPGVGTTDPRLVAIAGERAAWNERAPDSWEYVMPWQVRSEQQRRLVAGGYRVRVVLRSGPASAALRRPAGRS
jgi:proline dehydrogenase